VLLLKYFTQRGGLGYRSRYSDCLRIGRFEARNLVEARPSSSVSTMQRCPFLKESQAMMPPSWQVCVFVTHVLQLNWTVFVMHPCRFQSIVTVVKSITTCREKNRFHSTLTQTTDYRVHKFCTAKVPRKTPIRVI
jgi:hypothetical protein